MTIRGWEIGKRSVIENNALFLRSFLFPIIRVWFALCTCVTISQPDSFNSGVLLWGAVTGNYPYQ